MKILIGMKFDKVEVLIRPNNQKSVIIIYFLIIYWVWNIETII